MSLVGDTWTRTGTEVGHPKQNRQKKEEKKVKSRISKKNPPGDCVRRGAMQAVLLEG